MRRAGLLLVTVLALSLLGGCGDGNGAIGDDAPEAGAESAAQSAGPADITAGKDWGPRVTDDERGTVLKKVGQWAALGDDEDEVLVAFRITAIEPDLRCTEEDAQEPVNGQFIGLRLEVETSPDLGLTGSRATFNVRPEQFSAVLPGGGTEARLLGGSLGCLPRADLLPDAVAAGRSASGMVVLDVPEDTEAVVLKGSAFGSVGGWEWALP